MIQRKKHSNLAQIQLMLLVSIFLSSCVTNKKIEYLQMADGDKVQQYEMAGHDYYRIQAGDELYIDVNPFDPELKETFSIENARVSFSEAEAMLNLQSFTVYSDGCIDFPMLGKIEMSGLTTREARSKMESLLIGTFFNEAKITVKLVNNYVSVIGDVKRPGKFVIYKEDLNIFQALAMAGDVSTFGDRANVRIVRHTPQKTYIENFDLRSQDIITSKYYYVQPNDVIYVSRIKGQFFGMDSFTDFVSLVSGSLSILALSFSLWKN